MQSSLAHQKVKMDMFSVSSPFLYAVTTAVVWTGSILYAKKYIERKQRELEARTQHDEKDQEKKEQETLTKSDVSDEEKEETKNEDKVRQKDI